MSEKEILEKYKQEVMNLRFCFASCSGKFSMECKEAGDFLSYIVEKNKKIATANETYQNSIPIFQKRTDILKPIEIHLTGIYGEKINDKLSKLIELVDYKEKNEYYGVTKRKYDTFNGDISKIIIEGSKDTCSSTIAMHELVHGLLPFTSNMYHNETMPLMHEWIYMDKNYHFFRSLALFSETYILDKEYSDIENKELEVAIKEANKFMVEMYTISYVYSLVLKKYYLENPKLFAKMFLLYINDPLYIEKLLEFYHIKFDSEETYKIVKNNYKVLKK